MASPIAVNPSLKQQQVWSGRRSQDINSLLLMNTDLNNTVLVGSDITSLVVPILPNGSLSVDPADNWYAVWSVAGGSPLVILPNGQSNFLGITQALGSLTLPSIRSPNYVTGVSGWTINKDGSVEFNNGTFRGVLIAGGLFIYVGTPAPGNIPVAWVSEQAADPFGNSLPVQDIVSYSPVQQIFAQLSAGQINIGKTSLTQPGSIAQSGASLHPGAMLLTSPQVGANTRSQLILEDSGEISGPGIVTTTPIRANDPAAITNFTADTWHDLGTLAGYTVTRAQYKLGIEDQTWLFINVTSLGANAATVSFSNTLATAYRPVAVVFQPLTFTGASTAAPRVSLSSAGVVSITQQANNAIQILGCEPIPLD